MKNSKSEFLEFKSSSLAVLGVTAILSCVAVFELVSQTGTNTLPKGVPVIAQHGENPTILAQEYCHDNNKIADAVEWIYSHNTLPIQPTQQVQMPEC